MLKAGDQAPSFSLRSHTGTDWDLKSALEKGPVVVFFYPKDDTPVCIVEVCTFRDRHNDFVGKGAEVVGISRDSLESHKSFAGRYELPYTLLSDPDGKVRELFGVKKTLGFFDGRVTFVVDKKGVVRHSFSSQLNAKAHVDEALRILNQLG